MSALPAAAFIRFQKLVNNAYFNAIQIGQITGGRGFKGSFRDYCSGKVCCCKLLGFFPQRGHQFNTVSVTGASGGIFRSVALVANLTLCSASAGGVQGGCVGWFYSAVAVPSVQRQGPLCDLHPPVREHACAAPVLASQHWLPVCRKDRFSRFYYVFKSLNGLSDLLSPSSGWPRSSEGRRSRDLCCHPPDWAGCSCNSSGVSFHCDSRRFPVFALSREVIVFCFCCVFTANDSRKCLNRTRPLCLFPALDVLH